MAGAAGAARRVLKRGRRRGRQELREGVERIELHAWRILLCAVGAAVAYGIAGTLLGHPAPFLAPIAAMIGIGVAQGRKLRRTAEVLAGVALGVLVGTLAVALAGTGLWQICAAVLVAMSLGVLLDGGPLLSTQAGVNAVIVTTLLPSTGDGLSRWLDAAVGGAVALAAVALSPLSPYRTGRALVADLLSEVSGALRLSARALEERDRDLADDALVALRGTSPDLEELRTYLGEAAEVVRVSPLRRRHRGATERYVSLVEPLDRAVRNLRVLARRVVITLHDEEPVAEAHPPLLRALADAVDLLAGQLRDEPTAEAARRALEDVAARTADPAVLGAGLSAQVVLAQLRSTVVDLLQVTGLDLGDAVEAVPRMPDDGRSGVRA